MAKAADLYAELGLKKDKYDKGMKDAEQAPGRLGKAFSAAGVAIAASLTIVAAGLVSISKQAIEAWDAQEKANQGLLVALNGRKDIQQALLEQASQLQRTTLFEDDAIIQAQKMLAVMGLSAIQIKDLIPLIADFSTATGMDMVQAANLVGKAIGTGTNALGRYGVELDATMSKTEKANEIMAIFTERYGNQAAAAARTGASGLQQLNKAWGEILETVGGKIGPFIAALAQLISGKGLEATSGAAATGMQKTINEYINADAAGRAKVIAGLDWSLKEYRRKWKEAKDAGNVDDRAFYATQIDLTQEALDKIAELNKENKAEISAEDQTALDEKRRKAAEEVQIAKEMYQKLEFLRMDLIDMSGVGSVGENLFSKFNPNVVEIPDLNIEPLDIPIDIQKFNDNMLKVQADTQNFIDNMNAAMSQFVGDFVGQFAEGIGQLMSGNIGMEQFFNSILGAFGDFISQMGKMLIAYGIGMEAFKKAFTNPFAAIAAGIALTVIGGLISGLASKGPSTTGMTGGGSGGSYGGGMYGSNTQEPAQLVAVVSGNDLKFILDKANRNAKRVG